MADVSKMCEDAEPLRTESLHYYIIYVILFIYDIYKEDNEIIRKKNVFPPPDYMSYCHF